jgi:quercetin dioxygenase-like cupin family protein
MNDRVFSEEAIASFRTAYPDRPLRLTHGLVGHPLLTLEAIATLAERLPPSEVEYNAGNLPIAIPQHATPGNGLSIADTIRTIDENGSWMVLKRVEQDPVYRTLLHDTLAELRPTIGAVTGEMLQLEGFLFVSSPGAVTPIHFDPEYNILCQLRGTKTMTIFPAEDEEIAPPEFHEAYHGGGQRNLAWQQAFAPRGTPVEIGPGQAVYVPLKAPHWVKNGPEVSISFSITWRSDWSFEEAYAREFNRRLRRLGLRPSPPRRFPERNRAKSVAQRALNRAERLVPGLRG